MDAKAIDKICGQIYRRFPEVSGSKPKVQTQDADRDEQNYLMIFKGSGTTADGKKIDRTVRVVATGAGKILKVTTSR
jgi:hypothetical protein